MKIYCSGKPAKSWNERRTLRRWVISHVNYITKNPSLEEFFPFLPWDIFRNVRLLVTAFLQSTPLLSARLSHFLSFCAFAMCLQGVFPLATISSVNICIVENMCIRGAQCNERARARLFLQKRIWKLGRGKRNLATPKIHEDPIEKNEQTNERMNFRSKRKRESCMKTSSLYYLRKR